MDITEPRLKNDPAARWMGMALAAHSAWGLYPVLARFLQVESGLPTFALAAAGNLIILVLVTVFLLPRRPLRQSLARFTYWPLWVFGAIVVLRSATNLLSARYTLAVNVQLINLLTPFLVAFLNARVFKVKPPRFTGIALSVSLAGAVMMVLGANRGPAFRLSSGDLLGIAIALASCVFLALYMILTRRTMDQGHDEMVIFTVQIFSLTVVMGLLSLTTGEDWSQWTRLRPVDWGMFAAFVVVALFGANWAQIQALKHTSATLVSSVLAWRLVMTAVGAWLILGERFGSGWQYLGAALVIGSVSWYLGQQVRS